MDWDFGLLRTKIPESPFYTTHKKKGNTKVILRRRVRQDVLRGEVGLETDPLRMKRTNCLEFVVDRLFGGSPEGW